MQVRERRLITFAYLKRFELDIILPVFIGINMILAAGRLLWMNLTVRETERAREERLMKVGDGKPE